MVILTRRGNANEQSEPRKGSSHGLREVPEILGRFSRAIELISFVGNNSSPTRDLLLLIHIWETIIAKRSKLDLSCMEGQMKNMQET